MGQKIWSISSFLNLVRYYIVNKFYEKIPIITNIKRVPEMDTFGTLKKPLTQTLTSKKCILKGKLL